MIAVSFRLIENKSENVLNRFVRTLMAFASALDEHALNIAQISKQIHGVNLYMC